jgi:hypothetical protein
MKRRIRLTESDLHRIIRKQVKMALNEGSASQEVYNKWLDIQENIGSDRMINDIWNYLSSVQLEQLIEYFNQDYDLFPEEDEEEY